MQGLPIRRQSGSSKIRSRLASTRRRWKASAKNSSETEVTFPPRATDDTSVGNVKFDSDEGGEDRTEADR